MNVHPSHHYKYCPRCKEKGHFDSDAFSFTCPKCGFQFFLNAAAAVTALIFNDRNELLMTRRGVNPAYGKLDLPGGFIDPNESAEEALMREVKEELDLVPDHIQYYASFPNEYIFSGTIVFTVDIVFKCLVNDFSNLKYRDDIIGIEFKSVSQIDRDDLPFQSVKNLIKRIQNEQ